MQCEQVMEYLSPEDGWVTLDKVCLSHPSSFPLRIHLRIPTLHKRALDPEP